MRGCCSAAHPDARMRPYIDQHAALGVAHEDVPDLCLRLYQAYGTTLAGLVAEGRHGDIDHEKWHAAVHAPLPYAVALQGKDEALRAMLQRLPQRRIVFTNADRAHAETCLAILGVRDLFEDVICFETLNPDNPLRAGASVLNKPKAEAFEHALRLARADAATTLFCDDSRRNVEAAAKAGIFAVHVGGEPGTEPPEGVTVAIDCIKQLPGAVPQLLELPPEKLRN